MNSFKDCKENNTQQQPTTSTTGQDKDSIEFSVGKDDFKEVRQRGPFRWILAHLLYRTNKIIMFVIFFGNIISSIISAGLMVTIGNALDSFAAGNNDQLVFYAVLVFLFAVGSPFLNLFLNLTREVLAQRIEVEAREEFYINLLGKSQSFHDSQKIGDLMARATNDVRMLNFMVSPGISLLFQSFMNLITPIVVIYLLFPSELLLTPLAFVILFLITLRGYTQKLTPVTQQLRSEFGEMNSVLNETLSGIEVVKGSTTEEYEMKRYLENALGYKDAFIEQARITAKYIPLLLIGLAITAGLGHGIILYLAGIFTVGNILTYVGLLSNLRFPTFISIWVFNLLKLAISGAERLLETMNTTTEIDANPDGIDRKLEGKVEFKDVSFSYPSAETDKLILKNISFTVQPGKTVAIVGTTGSGKTTLTKLISRLYDVQSGAVKIDGIDVRCWNIDTLRSQISYIEQDTFLFSDSLAENISFGRTSSIEEIRTVAQQAQAHEFIKDLPEEYKSEVGERGVQLSGGQRQRIAIARAFLSDPKILILDDSTSAIDSETEDQIQKAIARVQKDRTTFIITHRLSQIRWSDLILVMKHGEIVAQGTHEELMQTSPEYRKIFVKRFDMDDHQLEQLTSQEQEVEI